VLAVVYAGTLSLEADHPEPGVTPGEAVIGVRLAGVCNTDLEIARGYMNFRGVLGHEFVGEVLEAEDPGWVGARVVGEINCGCGRCPWCLGGLERHCPMRTVLGILGRDGTFAERTRLPLRNLHRVPAGVSDTEAVFVEPVAACCEILEQVEVRRFDRRAVLGDGKLGLLAAQVLAADGATVTLIGKHPEKMALVATEHIQPRALAQLEPRPTFDLVVECTGAPEGLRLATELVLPRGTIVLKSTTAQPPTLPASRWVVDEITVLGSRCGRFRPALDLLSSGALKLAELVSARLPLRQALSAFERAQAPGVVKVLIDVQAD
jgi:alcohol dehydrogenase